MAQAKLWEEAFLKEMESFQRSTVDKFQIAFSAEVGALQSPWLYACNPSWCGSVPVKSKSWLYFFLDGPRK